jgi:phosphohistidine phosphatase SixA
MLVGHNPGCEDLTTLLTGDSPAYPTAALGTIRLDVESWSDAGPGCGTLHAHVKPAGLLPSGS